MTSTGLSSLSAATSSAPITANTADAAYDAATQALSQNMATILAAAQRPAGTLSAKETALIALAVDVATRYRPGISTNGQAAIDAGGSLDENLAVAQQVMALPPRVLNEAVPRLAYQSVGKSGQGKKFAGLLSDVIDPVLPFVEANIKTITQGTPVDPSGGETAVDPDSLLSPKMQELIYVALYSLEKNYTYDDLRYHAFQAMEQGASLDDLNTAFKIASTEALQGGQMAIDEFKKLRSIDE